MLAGTLLLVAATAHAQPLAAQRFQLAGSVRADEAPREAIAQLERLGSLVRERQYDEALELLRRVADEFGRRLVRAEPNRWVTVRDFCHLQLAALPADVLEAYRKRTDAAADAAFAAAMDDRRSAALDDFLDRYYATRRGDEALVALGDLALERGDPADARRYWLQLFEVPPATIPEAAVQAAMKADGAISKLVSMYYAAPAANAAAANEPAHWLADPAKFAAITDNQAAALVEFCKQHGVPLGRLAYPSTDVPLAEIRARLVLASLLEGSLDRASEELAQFERKHAAADGYLAGQRGNLLVRLKQLFDEHKTWPPRPVQNIWTTFARSPNRNSAMGAAPLPAALGEPLWRASLPPPIEPDLRSERELLFRERRIGETWNAPTSYHPIVVDRRVFIVTADDVRALDLRTGKPVWPVSPDDVTGAIFRDEAAQGTRRGEAWTLGVPRYTASSDGNRLAVRLGPPATTTPADETAARRLGASKLVLLDVGAEGQGKLLCDPILADERFAFEGAPILVEDRLYVAMRRGDVRPEIHVACYQVHGGRSRLAWRTFVAAAETPGRGQMIEYTHNLLTLAGESLYCNTNVGAVASLATDDGRIRWLRTYRRAQHGELARLVQTGHFYRDLNPCLFDRGNIFVAPSDTPAVMALDATDGSLLWTTDAAADAVHLLAATERTLIASGDRLYALDARTGKVVCRWPDGASPDPRGIGRGLVAGNRVLWPTQEELRPFDLAASFRDRQWRMDRPPISLSRHAARGGNILWSDGVLLLATSQELIAWDTAQSKPEQTPR
jgi:outer membrane protein assembly factor BamB